MLSASSLCRISGKPWWRRPFQRTLLSSDPNGRGPRARGSCRYDGPPSARTSFFVNLRSEQTARTGGRTLSTSRRPTRLGADGPPSRRRCPPHIPRATHHRPARRARPLHADPLRPSQTTGRDGRASALERRDARRSSASSRACPAGVGVPSAPRTRGRGSRALQSGSRRIRARGTESRSNGSDLSGGARAARRSSSSRARPRCMRQPERRCESSAVRRRRGARETSPRRAAADAHRRARSSSTHLRPRPRARRRGSWPA